MSAIRDARIIQLGGLTGFVVGWTIGSYLFVPQSFNTAQIIPALATAGVGVAVGGYLALKYIGGDKE